MSWASSRSFMHCMQLPILSPALRVVGLQGARGGQGWRGMVEAGGDDGRISKRLLKRAVKVVASSPGDAAGIDARDCNIALGDEVGLVGLGHTARKREEEWKG